MEADAEKKVENVKRKEERRAAIVLLGSEEKEEGGVGYDDEEENAFLPGLVGSAVIFEEEQLAEFLDRDNDDSNRKRKKRRQFNYCLPYDCKELVSRILYQLDLVMLDGQLLDSNDRVL